MSGTGAELARLPARHPPGLPGSHERGGVGGVGALFLSSWVGWALARDFRRLGLSGASSLCGAPGPVARSPEVRPVERSTRSFCRGVTRPRRIPRYVPFPVGGRGLGMAPRHSTQAQHPGRAPRQSAQAMSAGKAPGQTVQPKRLQFSHSASTRDRAADGQDGGPAAGPAPTRAPGAADGCDRTSPGQEPGRAERAAARRAAATLNA